MNWQEKPVDSSESFKLGLSAAIAGDASTARAALWRVVGDDPHHELAWLWLAKVAETREERRLCLARALELDPRNGVTRELLARCEANREEQAKPTALGWCQICDLPWRTRPRRCPCCGCVQDFRDPAVFLSALEIDGRLTRRRLEELETMAEDSEAPCLELRRALALCYLNLGELIEARRQVSKLCHHDPSDERLRRLLIMLSDHLEAIQLESGFETESIERPALEELSLL